MMENLATEILQELKQNEKRWFIAFLVTLILWFATIGIFIWYITIPVEEYYDDYVVQEATDRSFNIIGGDYNGSETVEETPSLQEKGN